MRQFFSGVHKFVQEESMHGLSDGVKLGVAAESEMADHAMIQACDEFRQRDRVWEECNPENDLPQSKTWNAEDHLRAVLHRSAALEAVRTLAPLGVAGLIEKCKVFEDLVRWEPIEPGSVAEFSYELIKNYNSIFLKGYPDKFPKAESVLAMKRVGNGSRSKNAWRFNMKTFISNIGG
jgi:hypothetical protein